MRAILAARPICSLPRGLAIALVAGGTLLAGCSQKSPPANAAAGVTAPAASATSDAAESPVPPVPPPAVTQASWAPDTLEQLVAPIALYPDQLVGQILAASVNTQEVLDGGNWLLQNENLKGDALDAAAQKAGLGPAMRALVQFPTVVDMMCQQTDWTRQLGSAFTSDQKGVLDAVQRLRAQAAMVGNLKSTPQQKVETHTENQKVVIEVKPADPQVVYVPQYNPQVIYTTPPPPPPPAPAAPTTPSGTVSTGTAVAGGLLAFGVGVLVGSAIHSDDYCYPHWGAGAVFVGPRPFYPPAYVYHPAYGPGFRPAYRYAPPPNYRYAYNNARNVNVNVNNNYFNQFNHNQNLSGVTRNSGASWRGQSTYAGARNVAQGQRDVAQVQRNTAQAQRDVGHAERNVAQSQRNTAQNQQAIAQAQRNTARNQRNVEQTEHNTARNQRDVAQAQGNVARTQHDIAQPQHSLQDRGYGGTNPGAGAFGSGPARQPGNASPPASLAANSPQPEHAFSGAANPGSGAFERASSARGHASAGGLQASATRGRFRR
jgi:hypothetical protein